MSIKIVKLSETEAIPLPNDSWSKKVLTAETVGAGKMCMGVSKFAPGVVTDMLIQGEGDPASKGRFGCDLRSRRRYLHPTRSGA